MRQRRPHIRLRQSMCYVAGCLLLMAALSACLANDSNDDSPTVTPSSPSSEPTATSAPVPSQPPTATATLTSPPPPPSPTTALLPPPVQAAMDLAAETYEVPPEQITVLSFTERPWPSTALGCPQPGTSYAQIVTPGYQVELDIAGRRLTYHTDMQTTVIDCTGR